MSAHTRILRALRGSPPGKKTPAPLLALPKRPVSTPERFLCISTVFQNESPYFAEWLEFHRMLGVEHVYLYDNSSTDASLQVLAPFVKDRFVTVTPWPFPYLLLGIDAQLLAHFHALLSFGPVWRWMAFIDVDEFLFPLQGDSLAESLQAYMELPSVVVYWTNFGHSGHTTPPPGLVIENYTMRAQHLSKAKSIVDPGAVRSVSNPHVFDFDEGRRTGFDENRRFIAKFDGTQNKTSNVFRLNHYFTRSVEEFEAKMIQKEQVTHRLQKYRDRASEIEADPVHDEAILRFVPELKRRLHAGV